MRTKYCPHCGSENIHKVVEDDGGHFHECGDCNETWRHVAPVEPIKGSHDFK